MIGILSIGLVGKGKMNIEYFVSRIRIGGTKTMVVTIPTHLVNKCSLEKGEYLTFSIQRTFGEKTKSK